MNSLTEKLKNAIEKEQIRDDKYDKNCRGCNMKFNCNGDYWKSYCIKCYVYNKIHKCKYFTKKSYNPDYYEEDYEDNYEIKYK